MKIQRHQRHCIHRAGPFLAAAVVLVAALAPSATAQDASGADRHFNTNSNGVVLHGYDPVSYFSDDGPREGTASISAEWAGVTWHFASEENREDFLADPERYAPAYGGYCSFAVSRGGTADIDPEAYVVHDGTLYVNLSNFFNQRFRLSIDENIRRADENWPNIRERVRQ
jgi:YHS domain-containing protein